MKNMRKKQLADVKARFNSMPPEEQQKLGKNLEDALLNIQAEFEVKKKEISDQFKAQYTAQLEELKKKDEFKG